jgi:hypothetical protein
MADQIDLPGLPPMEQTSRLATLSLSSGMRTAEWKLPLAAAMGSTVRIKGIHREARNRLPMISRKEFVSEEGVFRFALPECEEERFAAAIRIVDEVLAGAADLPVMPTEAEEILTISARERLKWTKDGRLRSAGTRTVKLRGRAKAVTFHIHDPRHVEDVLDRDLPSIWREEDAAEIVENRRRGAGRAAATRKAKTGGAVVAAAPPRRKAAVDASDLDGWSSFAAEGLLA